MAKQKLTKTCWTMTYTSQLTKEMSISYGNNFVDK